MGFSHVLRLCLQGGGVYVDSGTVSFSSCTITGNAATVVRAHVQNFPSPDGKVSDVLAPTHALHNWECFGQLQGVRAAETLKVPIAPMGFSHVLRLCLQGGGVYINGGTVSFSSCTITGNLAYGVRAHAQKFPSPRWEQC